MTGETINSNNGSIESFSDLWDGYETVSKASEKGVLLLKDILKFFKKRIQSEDEYSKSLSKLVLKFEPQASDGYVGSKVKNVWDQIRLESLSQSSYHENICNNIQSQICEPIEGLVVDLEQKLKIIQIDAEKVFIIYQESVAKLRKSKQNYDKLAKESLEVTGVSKGETQKVQKRAIKAAQDVIKADKEYRSQITETNQAQKTLLTESLPKIMNDLQRVEMIRIHFIKSHFLKYFKSIEGQPQLTTNNDAQIIQMIQLLNSEEEIQEFVRKAKQQQQYQSKPKPFEYEPYIDRYPSSSPQQPISISISPSTSFNSNQYSSSPTSSSFLSNSSTESLSMNQRSFLTGSNGISSSLSNSSGGITNNNTNSSVEPSPTKDKRPWSLKRLSSAVGGFDKKALLAQIAAKSQQFGVKIDDVLSSQRSKYPNLDVPLVLVILKRKLIQLDVFQTQGIFRVPGNVVDINSYKKKFDEGNFEFSISENVYTIASLFKAWLRDLPDPLFPVSIYDQCVQQCEDKSKILALVNNQLPLSSQKVLSFVISLLQEAIQEENVLVSKMTSDNLAMVFAPCFLRSPYTDANILLGNIIKEKEFVKNLIENYKPLQLNEDDSLSSTQSGSGSGMGSGLSINSKSPPIVSESPPTSPSISSSKPKSVIPSTSKSVPTTPSKPIITTTNNNNNNNPTAITSTKQQTPTNNTPSLIQHPKVNELKQTSNIPLPNNNNSNDVHDSPKLTNNTIVTITPPITPKLEVGNNYLVNPIELLSPSDLKKRSNLQYTDLQEKTKELIDYTHNYINELYSDITTNEISCYYAMQSSLSIAKFTKSLETHITTDMQLNLSSLKESIQLNKFVSPPAIQFKIPSHLPKLIPSMTVNNNGDDEMISASIIVLRKWLTIVTLTVNRLNEYLCYFGGIVMRIYSPDNLETISSLFESLDSIKPIDNPKYKSLTLEQADQLTLKIIPLLDPLNPFTQDEFNINTSIKDTLTPPLLSPTLSHQQQKKIDEDEDPLDSNIIEKFKNTLIISDDQPQQQQQQQQPPPPQISPLLNSSMNTTESLEEEEITQFTFEDDNNAIKLEISRIINLMDQRLDMLENNQGDIKVIAKSSLSLKRELDEYILDNNIYIDGEQQPFIDPETDSLKKLYIMTNHFISRVKIILFSILNDSNAIHNDSLNLNTILLKYE